MRKGFLIVVILFVSSVSSGLIQAQNSQSVKAYKTDASVEIDGRLDENAWEQAESANGFRQFTPNEGDSATFPSEVKVLYGGGSLYIGAIFYDDNPGQIERTLGRRDEFNRADWFLASIDSYLDRQNAFTFGVNAAGVQYDAIRGSGGGGGQGLPGMDTSWDAVWYSAVRITSEGWVAEIQIPYSMLRFPETDLQTWGIHFTRRIPRLGEYSEWPLVPRVNRDNLIAQFGYLEEIRNIEPRPNIQFRPYMVSSYNSAENPTDPGEISTNTNIDMGGDLKVGLGPNITLDATINPDFGQVEADPAVLNLSAFEIFFEEQRPFFVEGIQIYEFDVGRGGLLYTRRIGSESPIIGATKLSGRTENGLSFGLLAATSGDNFNPERNYGVTRVSQQIGDYSSLGGILTFYDSPLENIDDRRRSYTGGADWDLRFLDNRYSVEGLASFTHRTTERIDDLETGIAGSLRIEKRQGIWKGFTGVTMLGDTFNPNDLGQLRSNNYIVSFNRIEYEINGGKSFGPFQQADAGTFITQSFSYDEGLNLGMDINFGSDWTLKTFQTIETGFSMDNVFGGYDQFETRGLGPYASPLSFEIQAEFETDERRPWQFSPEFEWTYFDDGGREYAAGLWGNWNVGSRLSLFANIEGEWEKNTIAWTANESFIKQNGEWLIGKRSAPPGELTSADYQAFDHDGELTPILSRKTPFDENAYFVPVFGERDTRSLDLTLRSTMTFTPDLSLQMYSQLFLARGRYDSFKILQNRDTLVDFPSYPKRDEFSLNSFQSNLVLRWEYQPGSTIFLVWSHGRISEQEINPLYPFGPSPYERPIGTQLRDTFDILPNNSLLVKVNYTFLY